MLKKLFATFQKNKHHITFAFLVILSLILIYNRDFNQPSYLRLKVNDLTSFIKSPIAYFNRLKNVEFENEILREKLTLSVLENEMLISYKAENSFLKVMLDLKPNIKPKLIPAKVTNMGLSANLRAMTIDVGTELGIKKNNPVITPIGIVGKVISVDKNSAVVQLINDPDFRISVRLQPSNATGILRWEANNICDVKEIYKNSPVNIGDRVVTSGLSDIFPAGLPVGKVISVTDDRSLFQKKVSVQIEDVLSTLIYVFAVVTED